MIPPPPRSTPFPYPTLFRSARRKQSGSGGRPLVDQLLQELDAIGSDNRDLLILGATNAPWDVDDALKRPGQDRKSTRLNSSHANISYAVFCLKKKKNIRNSK